MAHTGMSGHLSPLKSAGDGTSPPSSLRFAPVADSPPLVACGPRPEAGSPADVCREEGRGWHNGSEVPIGGVAVLRRPEFGMPFGMPLTSCPAGVSGVTSTPASSRYSAQREVRGVAPAPRARRHTPRNWRCNPETRAGSQFCRGDTEKIKWPNVDSRKPAWNAGFIVATPKK